MVWAPLVLTLAIYKHEVLLTPGCVPSNGWLYINSDSWEDSNSDGKD